MQLAQGVSLLSLALLPGEGGVARALATLHQLQPQQEQQKQSTLAGSAAAVAHLDAMHALLKAVTAQRDGALEAVKAAVIRIDTSSRGLTERDLVLVSKACRSVLQPWSQQHPKLHIPVSSLRSEQQSQAQVLAKALLRARRRVPAILRYLKHLSDYGAALCAIASVREAVAAIVRDHAADAQPDADVVNCFIEELKSGSSRLQCCPVQHLPYQPKGNSRPCKLPCGCVMSWAAATEALASVFSECALCEKQLSPTSKMEVDEGMLAVMNKQGPGRTGWVPKIAVHDLKPVLGKDGMHEVLGEGAEGIVYAYMWTQADGGTVRVAGKKLQMPEEGKRARLREASKYMVALWQRACVESSSMCMLHGVCWKNACTLLVMDVVKHSLETHVLQQGVLPRDKVLRIMLELACALHALHTRAGFMHLDVKPANVLLTVDLSVRLADFGLSKIICAGRTMPAGTPGYAAPEQHEGCACAKSDVYSLGATLLFCATRRNPPLGDSDASIAEALKYLPDLNGNDDAELRALVLRLTASEPAARITMEQARNQIRVLCRPVTAHVCPVTSEPLTSNGTPPRMLPCCSRHISAAGLQHRVSIGPRSCPYERCKIQLPDQLFAAFHAHDVLACMLAPLQVEVRSGSPCVNLGIQAGPKCAIFGNNCSHHPTAPNLCQTFQ